MSQRVNALSGRLVEVRKASTFNPLEKIKAAEALLGDAVLLLGLMASKIDALEGRASGS